MVSSKDASMTHKLTKNKTKKHVKICQTLLKNPSNAYFLADLWLGKKIGYFKNSYKLDQKQVAKFLVK